MIQIQVNGQLTERSDEKIKLDIVRQNDRQWHAIVNGKSCKISLDNLNMEEKSMQLSVNGKVYNIAIKDKFDLLLQQMGMSAAGGQKLKVLKAPMPGLVTRVLVQAGHDVKKGDNLLVLEAMKMENNIKAPGDGKVKKVAVKEQTAVEKGQLLIEFE